MLTPSVITEWQFHRNPCSFRRIRLEWTEIAGRWGHRCSQRSWDRVPVQIEVFCQKTRGEDELWWSAHVMDISRGGMKLLSPHKFDSTTAIRIGKAVGVEETSELIEASVAWAHPTPGEKWTLEFSFNYLAFLFRYA